MSIRAYLPSKKLSIILISITLVVIIFFVIKNIMNKKPQDKEGQKVSLTVSELIQNDSDKDGVADWEETLWGTDPRKADSNNDGISDFEEIKQKKDALSAKNNTEGGESTDAADDFARGIFASIISLKESNNLNENSINSLAGSIAGEAKERTALPNFIEEQSLHTIELTKESNKKYLTQLQSVIFEYEKKGMGTEYQSFSNYLKESSTPREDVISSPDLQKLGSIGDVYQDLAQALSKIPVPAKYVSLQASMVNNAYNTGVGLKNISTATPGSIDAMVGAVQYKKYSSDYDFNIQSLATLLIQNGILD